MAQQTDHDDASSPQKQKQQQKQSSSPNAAKKLSSPTKRKSDSDVGGYDPGEALRSEELNVGDPQMKVLEKDRSVTRILRELAAIQQQGPQKYCILGTRHCSYLHQQIIELLYVFFPFGIVCLLFYLFIYFVVWLYLGTYVYGGRGEGCNETSSRQKKTLASKKFLAPLMGVTFTHQHHHSFLPSRAYALVLSGNHVYTSGAGGTHAATIRGALRAEREDLLTVVLPQSLDRQTKESQQLLAKVEDVIEMPQNNDMSLDIASRICNSYLLSLTDQLISFAFHKSNTVIEATKEAKKLEMLVTMLYLD